MKPEIQSNKIVVFTGSGVSAESGLPTYRDSNGLWRTHNWHQLASPQGWELYPEIVLDFYNERRQQAWNAQPNAAHIAIASLEKYYEVVVITQNVDELHERAGSSQVIHLHGQLDYVRGTSENPKRYKLMGEPISIGTMCEYGTQLRPDVVWFGEKIEYASEARQHMRTAAKVLVVGTSLSVYPAATLANAARGRADKIIVSFDIQKRPYGYHFIRGQATNLVPSIASDWISEACNQNLKI
jgi:NAD-dependent deacetylase